VRVRNPFCVKKEHMWGCETQLVSKTKMCEDTRPSWCQKRKCVRIRDPVGVKKERMWGCETQLVSKRTHVRMRDPAGVKKELVWGCETQFMSKRNVCAWYSFLLHIVLSSLKFPVEAALRERKLKIGGYMSFVTASLKFLRLEINLTSQTISINVTRRRIRVNIVTWISNLNVSVALFIQHAKRIRPIIL
jgi:hypothetical protein